MNIAIDSPKKISINNVYILDSKRNMIMDGYFTKLIYSNEYFTMAGLYILFPIETTTFDAVGMKKQIAFNPNTSQNIKVIQDFVKLEHRILEFYKQTKQCCRKISNSLARHMYSGSMKVYKDYNQYKAHDSSKPNLFLLKISGIWETHETIGLTYKMYEIKENYISL